MKSVNREIRNPVTHLSNEPTKRSLAPFFSEAYTYIPDWSTVQGSCKNCSDNDYEVLYKSVSK